MAELEGDRELSRLRTLLPDLLDASWLPEAARLGWDDVAVFGCCPAAPAVRVECWGLAVSIVWSPHGHRGRLPKVEAIDGETARLRLPSGATCVAGRFARGLDHAVACWTLPAFTRPTRH